MQSDFKHLISFLLRGEAEVSGRMHNAPSGDLREKLERFVEGTCSESEKLQICELIRNDPACIKWVADRIKEKRGDQTP